MRFFLRTHSTFVVGKQKHFSNTFLILGAEGSFREISFVLNVAKQQSLEYGIIRCRTKCSSNRSSYNRIVTAQVKNRLIVPLDLISPYCLIRNHNTKILVPNITIGTFTNSSTSFAVECNVRYAFIIWNSFQNIFNFYMTYLELLKIHSFALKIVQ